MEGALYCKAHFEQLFKESGGSIKRSSSCNFFFFFFLLGLLHNIIWYIYIYILHFIISLIFFFVSSWVSAGSSDLVHQIILTLNIYFSLVQLISICFQYLNTFVNEKSWYSLWFYREGHLANSHPCFLVPKKNVPSVRKLSILWRRYTYFCFLVPSKLKF